MVAIGAHSMCGDGASSSECFLIDDGPVATSAFG